MDRKYYIGVDIGGSHISCALIDSQTREISGEISEKSVNSNASIEEILQVWQSAIREVMPEKADQLDGIGFAMPGPFEYERGFSMIEGVQKFDSLFGVNVRLSLQSILPGCCLPMAFLNDASAFALGEYYAGAAKGSHKTIIVTLGTGFGSTFLVDGVIQQDEKIGEIPPGGYFYNLPFEESIGDDYFSTRWFVNTWLKDTGEKVQGVKEIAEKALQGNALALDLFKRFIVNLASFMAPWLKGFNPDTFVIGGSIAKAAPLFLDDLRELLKEKNIQNINIKVCEQWDKAPLSGAALFTKSKLDMSMGNNKQIRKTEQFLAPEKASVTSQGEYDIYPAFPLGTGKIKGENDLATWIAQHKTVVIDGYVGVFWDHFTERLNAALKQQGKNVRWFNVDAAMKSPGEIDKMIEPYMGEKDSIFGRITDKHLKDWFDEDKLKKIQPDPHADINIIVGCGAALAGWNAPLVYVDLPKNELQFRMRAGVAFNLGASEQADSREMYKRFYFIDWRVLNDHKAYLVSRIDVIVDEQRPDDYLWMSGDDLRQGLTGMSRNFFRVRPWFEPGAWGGTWMKERIDGLNKDVANLAWSFELMVLENGLMFESDGYRLEVSFDFLMYNNYKEVLGDCAERFKYDFPIRFDFLDTFDGGNLSVQCHPRTDYIQKEFGMPFTQDETYYILDCKGTPGVYLGFQEGINPEEFHKELLQSEKMAQPIDIEKYVQKFDAKKHDFFLIPNGTIHASGKDNLVLEISSAPYIFTFKMYDWVRLDLDGRPRPINIDHGMKNVDFSRQGKRVEEEFISRPYIIDEDENCVVEHLPTHPMHFYDVHRYSFDKEIALETEEKCHVWMLVEGSSVIIETASGMRQRFNYAETFVVPAATGSYKIINEGNESALMLKSFVR